MQNHYVNISSFSINYFKTSIFFKERRMDHKTNLIIFTVFLSSYSSSTPSQHDNNSNSPE